jgi:hypothetical protein
MTRNGIENNLSISPYTVDIGNVTFVFSSMLHLNKFMQGYKNYRKEFAELLTRRFDITMTADKLADILYYRYVETRGFLIKVGGTNVWQPIIKLDGMIQIDGI